MLEITDEALKFLTNKLNSTKETGYILEIKTAGCSGKSYVIDYYNSSKHANYNEFRYQQITFYINKVDLDLINDTKIDYNLNELGHGNLVFTNRKATGSCGCGESFTINESE